MNEAQENLLFADQLTINLKTLKRIEAIINNLQTNETPYLKKMLTQIKEEFGYRSSLAKQTVEELTNLGDDITKEQILTIFQQYDHVSKANNSNQKKLACVVLQSLAVIIGIESHTRGGDLPIILGLIPLAFLRIEALRHSLDYRDWMKMLKNTNT